MDNSFFTSKFNGLALLGTALILVSGCLPRGTDLADQYAAPPPAMATVDFGALKANVLEPQCIRCHGGFATESGISSLVTPGNPEASTLYQVIANGTMPPGGPALGDASLAIVRTYIQGLVQPSNVAGVRPDRPDDGSTPTPTPAPGGPAPKVDFAMLKTKVLTPSCIMCHSDFEREQGVLPDLVPGNPDASELLQAVVTGRMPPVGGPLKPEQVETIRSYISGLQR